MYISDRMILFVVHLHVSDIIELGNEIGSRILFGRNLDLLFRREMDLLLCGLKGRMTSFLLLFLP